MLSIPRLPTFSVNKIGSMWPLTRLLWIVLCELPNHIHPIQGDHLYLTPLFSIKEEIICFSFSHIGQCSAHIKSTTTSTHTNISHANWTIHECWLSRVTTGKNNKAHTVPKWSIIKTKNDAHKCCHISCELINEW